MQWRRTAYPDFVEALRTHAAPVLPETTALSDAINGGVVFKDFSVEKDLGTNPNLYSVVMFLSYGGNTLCFPGDAETATWEELLQQAAVRDWLRKTTILIAPHHGRESGWHDGLSQYCKPKLCIISDGGIEETSIADYYSELASGYDINGVARKRLTTYTHGRIEILLGANGSLIVDPAKGV